MKKIFSLFAAVLFVGSMFAETYSFTFAKGDLKTSTTEFTYSEVTWTLSAPESQWNGTEGKTGYVFGSAKNPVTLTVSTSDIEGTITEVSVVGRSNNAGKNAVVSVKVGTTDFEGTGASWDNGNNQTAVFTGSAAGTLAVTITPDACGFVLAGISVEYAKSAAAVEKPTIAGDACFQNEIEVSLSCKTDGAKIYYTLDGSEPTASSTAYSDAAFKLTASATVKAIAIKGEDKSAIAEKAFTAYPTSFNCADAAAAALSVSANNELYACGLEFTVRGYVTEIPYAYDSEKGNMTFWMADAKDGGQVLEAYKVVPESADKVPAIGAYVEVAGNLTKYVGKSSTTPEFAAGCTCKILQTPTALDNTNAAVKVEKFFRDGQLIIRKNGVEYNATGAIIK